MGYEGMHLLAEESNMPGLALRLLEEKRLGKPVFDLGRGNMEPPFRKAQGYITLLLDEWFSQLSRKGCLAGSWLAIDRDDTVSCKSRCHIRIMATDVENCA